MSSVTSALANFLATEFPQSKSTVTAAGGMAATVRHEIGPDELRPGGTVAGPVLMAVADVALYVAILGEIGIVPLAVTSNLSINFLRKPPADRAIIGKCNSMRVCLGGDRVEDLSRGGVNHGDGVRVRRRIAADCRV